MAWVRTLPHLCILAGTLLQVHQVHLLGLLERLVVGLVDGSFEPEGIVTIDLLPVDGAICAVHRLVPKLRRAKREGCSD